MAFADASHDQGEKDKTHNPSSALNSPIALWPATLAFLILSSVLFAWLFEWNRYQVITAYRLHSLSLLDQVLLFWLLVAKSLGWFVPLLLMAAVLMALGLTRIALLVLNCFWIGIFYFMAVDLVAVNYTAYHAWEYWLPMREILAHPQHQLTRWLTEETHCGDIGGFRRVRDFRPTVLRFMQTDRNETWPRVPALAASPGSRVDGGPVRIRDWGSCAGPVLVQRSECTGPNFCLFAVSYRDAGSLTVFRRETRRLQCAGS